MDNIFVERLWRTLKYEEIYLNDYAGVGEAVRSLGSDRIRHWGTRRLRRCTWGSRRWDGQAKRGGCYGRGE